MKEIVVIGHSLSPVDYLYFREITEENLRPNELQWKISWYSDADKDRIRKFASIMGINEKNIEMFNFK